MSLDRDVPYENMGNGKVLPDYSIEKGGLMLRMIFEVVMVLAVVGAIFFMMKVAAKENDEADTVLEKIADDDQEK